jgi:hypothetical protein
MEKNKVFPHFRCAISPLLSDLESLHQICHWIPGANSIRPTEQILMIKNNKRDEISRYYKSNKDYILATVFLKPAIIDRDGKFHITDSNVRNQIKFLPNEFPYDVSGNHWVLWYGHNFEDNILLPDEVITADITQALQDLLNHNDFDFAWYINPKMTIPEFFHVQIFWIDLS